MQCICDKPGYNRAQVSAQFEQKKNSIKCAANEEICYKHDYCCSGWDPVDVYCNPKKFGI